METDGQMNGSTLVLFIHAFFFGGYTLREGPEQLFTAVFSCFSRLTVTQHDQKVVLTPTLC